MPQVTTPDELKSLFGLANVHIHQASKNGVSYVGLEFECTWDSEHGLGVMIHKNRIVDFGGADTAILEWIADRDAQRWNTGGHIKDYMLRRRSRDARRTAVACPISFLWPKKLVRILSHVLEAQAIR
jgi:hypothetical protein